MKEYDRMLAVCDSWSRSGVAYDYLLIGDGPKRQEFADIIKSGGLSVCLPGYRDLLDLLEPEHLFVHPCDAEGFGLAPLEAALSGVPVVIAEGAGGGEVLQSISHVLQTNFRRDPNVVGAEIMKFWQDVDVRSQEVEALRERLAPETYAKSVDELVSRVCA